MIASARWASICVRLRTSNRGITKSRKTTPTNVNVSNRQPTAVMCDLKRLRSDVVSRCRSIARRRRTELRAPSTISNARTRSDHRPQEAWRARRRSTTAAPLPFVKRSDSRLFGERDSIGAHDPIAGFAVSRDRDFPFFAGDHQFPFGPSEEPRQVHVASGRSSPIKVVAAAATRSSTTPGIAPPTRGHNRHRDFSTDQRRAAANRRLDSSSAGPAPP